VSRLQHGPVFLGAGLEPLARWLRHDLRGIPVSGEDHT
jgi:hypothetical protein